VIVEEETAFQFRSTTSTFGIEEVCADNLRTGIRAIRIMAIVFMAFMF
jgi:hypothetical protein